jgi:hypothetical protein
VIGAKETAEIGQLSKKPPRPALINSPNAVHGFRQLFRNAPKPFSEKAKFMIDDAPVVVMPAPPISLFGRLWPLVGLATAVIANLAWIGLLGYGLFKLIEPAIFLTFTS